jgi:hypothetical protein
MAHLSVVSSLFLGRAHAVAYPSASPSLRLHTPPALCVAHCYHIIALKSSALFRHAFLEL